MRDRVVDPPMFAQRMSASVTWTYRNLFLLKYKYHKREKEISALYKKCSANPFIPS